MSLRSTVEISMGDIKASEKWPSRSSCFLLFLMFETVGLNFKPLKENGYFFVLFSAKLSYYLSLLKNEAPKISQNSSLRNSWHIATPPDWFSHPQIPYWWRITTPIWVASDWSCRLGNLFQPIKKHYPDLASDTSSVQDFLILREIQCCFLRLLWQLLTR